MPVGNVDNSNRLNGAPPPRRGREGRPTNPLQDYFNNGGNIFGAADKFAPPPSRSNNDNDGGGSGRSSAAGNTTASNNGTANAKNAANDAKGILAQIPAQVAQMKSRMAAFMGKVTGDTKNAVEENTNALTAGQEVQDLTKQRDQEAGNATDGPNYNDPNNISGIGAAPNTQPGSGAGSGSTGGTGGTGNSRVNELNSQIAAKTGEQEQASDRAGAAVAKIRADYKANIAPFKAASARMDGRIKDAEGKAQTAAKLGQLGQLTTTAGGLATVYGGTQIAAGTAAAASPATAASAPPLFASGAFWTKTGASATMAGGLATMGASVLKGYADKQKAEATAGKAKIAAQSKIVVKSYAKAMVDARRNA